MLLMVRDNRALKKQYQMNALGKLACVLALVAVLIDVLLTFVECGPYQCPDNPVTYWLLRMFS